MFKRHLGSERRQNKHFIFPYSLRFIHFLLSKWTFCLSNNIFSFEEKGLNFKDSWLLSLSFSIPSQQSPSHEYWRLLLCLSSSPLFPEIKYPFLLLKMQITDIFYWQLHSVFLENLFKKQIKIMVHKTKLYYQSSTITEIYFEKN